MDRSVSKADRKNQTEKKAEDVKANASNNSDEIESLKFEMKEPSEKISNQFETEIRNHWIRNWDKRPKEEVSEKNFDIQKYQISAGRREFLVGHQVSFNRSDIQSFTWNF